MEVELKNAGSNSVFISKNKNKNSIPKNVKFELTGHRLPINHVCFHPKYNVLVSSSDDCTMIIWDADTGKN